MSEALKTPETINQILLFVSGAMRILELEKSKNELNKIERDLMKMKQSPELHNNCNIDFKIDNPEFYINQVNNIIKNDRIH